MQEVSLITNISTFKQLTAITLVSLSVSVYVSSLLLLLHLDRFTSSVSLFSPNLQQFTPQPSLYSMRTLSSLGSGTPKSSNPVNLIPVHSLLAPEH